MLSSHTHLLNLFSTELVMDTRCLCRARAREMKVKPDLSVCASLLPITLGVQLRMALDMPPICLMCFK